MLKSFIKTSNIVRLFRQKNNNFSNSLISSIKPLSLSTLRYISPNINCTSSRLISTTSDPLSHPSSSQQTQTQTESQQNNIPTSSPDKPILILLPDDGHKSVTVSEFYKKVGDFVKENEKVCEIDTPDYAYDFNTQISGYIAEIVSPVDDKKTINPGDLLFVMVKTEEGLKNYKPTLKKVNNEEKIEDKLSSKQEVSEWLTKVKPKYIEYTDIFIKEGFDSVEEIMTLTEEDMEKMGLKKGHARAIMAEIVKQKGTISS